MQVQIYVEKKNLLSLNKSIEDMDTSLIPEYTNQFPWQYPRRGDILKSGSIGVLISVDAFIWLEDNKK